MASEEIHLTVNPLDSIPPRNYVRLLFPLPLKTGVEDKVVFNDLHLALHKTFVQEPWASGKVFRKQPTPAAPNEQQGQLEIRYRTYTVDQPLPHQLRYHRLDTVRTYRELQEDGFPSGVFTEEDLLCDAPRVGDMDEGAGANIFLAQANFLCGGVLLAVTTSHAATDAAGMLAITRLWAENFRELYERDAGGRVAESWLVAADRDRTLPDTIWQRDDNGHVSKGSSRSGADDTWLRGLVGLDLNYQKSGPITRGEATNVHVAHGDDDVLSPRHPPTMLNRVMFLSSGDLAALHAECTAEAAPADLPPLSVSDAISALMWRCLLRARAAAAAARSVALDEVSVFESPVDVRGIFSADFPPNYLGNCFLLNTSRMSLSELVAPSTSLGRVAQAIRRSAARLDGTAIHDAYALLRAADDLSSVQGRFVEPEATSADLLVSNIIHFPMTDLDFGDRYFGNGGVPQSLRVLHGQYAPYVRLGHILPRNAVHGGVELSVNLFEDEMAYLDEDEEFNKYLVLIEAPDIGDSLQSKF